MYAKQEEGNVLIITMLFFVAIALSIGMGLVLPVLKAHANAEHELNSKRSYFISESGVEDVVYRLTHSMTVSSTETLTLGSEQATTSISDISSTKKQITALGDSLSRNRIVSATIEQGEGVSFNYGVQVGRGGMTLSGSSGIKGNVYANGNITGCSSCYITGSAIAANSESLSADQQNGTGTPTNDVVFGKVSTSEDIAQSFTVSTEVPLNKAQLYLKKNGNPSNATVYIVADNGGVPGTTYLASGTLSASSVTTSYGWTTILFTTNPTLQTGTTYWLVVNASTSSSNYYTVGANVGGYAGTAKIGKYSGTWNVTSPSTLDYYFGIYLGGLTSTISGESQYNQLQIGSTATDVAKAGTVNYVNAKGTIYCQSGTGNNKTCNTTEAAPAPQPWPVSDANIADWESQAAVGGTSTGDYSLAGSSKASLGPKKIVGNMHIGASAVLTVTGPLWITGNLTVDGSAVVKLDASYGSGDGIIVVGGRIIISGSSPIQGSGTTGSYIMAVSLSDCPISSSCSGANAIDVSGSAGAVVLVAQNGTVSFTGSASAKQATGYGISLSGSTSVSYESGLADMNFTSGPSGSWTVTSWKETQ